MMRRARSARGSSSIADPDVRVIVNTGAGDAFQTGLDVAQLSRDPDALREQCRRTQALRAPVHRLAQRRVQAGDRGGQRRVRRRRAALRRRRRHRDRVGDATFLDPHVSVGQVDRRTRRSRWRRSRRWKPILRMAFIGRARAHLGRTRATSWASSSQVVDPPEQLAGRGPGARSTKIAATERARTRSSRSTDACRALGAVAVGPPRPDEGPHA